MTRRRLPHIYPDGKALFVTWHLHGSPPASCFAHGPQYLARPDIACLVIASIHKGVALAHYDLHAYVVMANHVHLLIDPKIDPSQLLKSLKGATAREANRLLGRTGEPFWQKESYDHWVRNQAELD